MKEFNLDGVGLFRTEFLFLESHERPSVRKQFEIYDKIAGDLDGRRLVMRTFDLGGDKLPPFLLAEQSDAQDSLHLTPRLYPVCGHSSYSSTGIYPQCAVTQADAPRKARLATEKKAILATKAARKTKQDRFRLKYGNGST